MRCHSVHEGDVPVRNILAADNVYKQEANRRANVRMPARMHLMQRTAK